MGLINMNLSKLRRYSAVAALCSALLLSACGDESTATKTAKKVVAEKPVAQSTTIQTGANTSVPIPWGKYLKMTKSAFALFSQ